MAACGTLMGGSIFDHPDQMSLRRTLIMEREFRLAGDKHCENDSLGVHVIKSPLSLILSLET